MSGNDIDIDKGLQTLAYIIVQQLKYYYYEKNYFTINSYAHYICAF